MNDLISRQAAIDEINRVIADYIPLLIGKTEEIPLTLAKAIKNMPPAQRWIPCSKKLPKELVPVNVTWINRDPGPYYEKIKDVPFTDTAVYYEGKWYWQSCTCVDLLGEYGESPADEIASAIDIIAWMPLPEPYKGE